MTLILAIAYDEGVLMAADSAGSDADSGTKQPTTKIRRVAGGSILCGGSGDAGLLQKVMDNLNSLSLSTSFKRIRQEIKKAVVVELKESATLHVPYPQQGFHQPPAALVLCAGVTGDMPWILEIERDGRDTLYGPELGNFAAIGSGKAFAQALFRPHLQTKRDLQLSKIFAHRVVDDAIELSAQGLARPIHMWTVAKGGRVQQIEVDEIDRLSETCELWRSLEREAVGTLLDSLSGRTPTAPPTELLPEIPAPAKPAKPQIAGE